MGEKGEKEAKYILKQFKDYTTTLLITNVNNKFFNTLFIG
jgi:hypothetical protein